MHDFLGFFGFRFGEMILFCFFEFFSDFAEREALENIFLNFFFFAVGRIFAAPEELSLTHSNGIEYGSLFFLICLFVCL